MTKDEMKDKCAERTKIFQQAMESCKSSNPIDCIEWFADRIAELEKVCQDLSDKFDYQVKQVMKLEKENAELKEEIKNNEDLATVAYMQGAEQQKKKSEKQLTKAKELLNEFMRISKASDEDFEHDYSELIGEAEQFLKEVSE